jgi:ABC-type multidrug transport system fused ATPase/permease subunit
MKRVKLMEHTYGWVLLPLYFILHGWQYYSRLLNFSEVVSAFLIVLLSACFVWLLSFILSKLPEKRSLLTTFACFLLFFTNPLITTFSARNFLPGVNEQIVFIVFAVLLVWLLLRLVKESIRSLNKLVNVFLSMLVAVAFFQVLYSLVSDRKVNDSFANKFYGHIELKDRRSVYLIILDEYAGKETLASDFGYNNNRFIQFLKDRKFHVADSATSNYSYTLLSVPSLLAGSYIGAKTGEALAGVAQNKEAMLMMYENNIAHYFSKAGYKIKNYSPFGMNVAPNYYDHRFLPMGKYLLLYPSLIDDLAEKAPEFFVSKFAGRKQITSFYAKRAEEFKPMLASVLKDTEETTVPMFTYLHIMLPHFPYLRDSAGGINIHFLSKKDATETDKKNAYLQQLVYTNKVIAEFVDSLLVKTNGEAVIVLMSDHGYKSGGVRHVENRFNIINAVYYPGMPDLKRYNGMSNVNQFRSILSYMSGTHLPREVDSLSLK